MAQRRPLACVDDKAFEYAIWGENRDRPTAVVHTAVVDGLVQAQELGIDFGVELWALSRQLHHELLKMRTDIQNNRPELANGQSMQRATAYIDQFELIYLDENFRQDVSGIEKAFWRPILWRWLQRLTSGCLMLPISAMPTIVCYHQLGHARIDG